MLSFEKAVFTSARFDCRNHGDGFSPCSRIFLILSCLRTTSAIFHALCLNACFTLLGLESGFLSTFSSPAFYLHTSLQIPSTFAPTSAIVTFPRRSSRYTFRCSLPPPGLYSSVYFFFFPLPVPQLGTCKFFLLHPLVYAQKSCSPNEGFCLTVLPPPCYFGYSPPTKTPLRMGIPVPTVPRYRLVSGFARSLPFALFSPATHSFGVFFSPPSSKLSSSSLPSGFSGSYFGILFSSGFSTFRRLSPWGLSVSSCAPALWQGPDLKLFF